MKKNIIHKIKNNKVFGGLVVPSYRKIKPIIRIPEQINLSRSTRKTLNAERKNDRIYYIGIPAHNNLGDLAQGVCIRRWLNKHFSDREIVEIETNALVNTKFSVINNLKAVYQEDDIIVFQSGYTTTDLGGYADELHCEVIKVLPEAKILMMPQTIFFESEKRKKNTSLIYNSAQNMLFLARDRISFGMAEEMFPDLSVVLYPDIVTTLIGQFEFENSREGILFCCRDDSEKYYSDTEIEELIQKCKVYTKVERTDTTKNIKINEIVKNAEQYIMSEIERYSKYQVIITDRYHGTIFSLIAGTPVVIIKTTDHKVTTGAEWFRGIYDNHVHLADSLEEAYEITTKMVGKDIGHRLKPYFENEYYDKLPEKFDRMLHEIREKRREDK